ncbi:MAG: hypothetical protein QM776_06070 [Rhodocyclaceae bacterium]
MSLLKLRHHASRLIGIGLSTLLLSACGLVPVKTLEQTLQPKTSIAEGNAVIVVKVQMGQGSFLPAHLKWQGLNITEVTDGASKARSQASINVEPVYAEHSLFVAEIPAGKWRLSGVSTMQFNGDGSSISYGFPLSSAGTFSVKAGELVELGSIAILPTGKSVESGNRNERRTQQRMVAMIVPLSPAERAQLLQIVSPRLPASLKLREEPSWELSPLQKLLAEPAFRQGESKRFASPLIQNGEALFGEEFGQIRIRRGGQWDWMDTGLSGNVSAIARMDDGTLLAGGALGVVLFKRPGGNTWESRPLPARDAVIAGLHAHPKIGVIAAVRHGPELIVWSMKSLDAPWTELRRFSASGNSNFGTAVNVQTSIGNKRFYARVNEVAFTADSNLHVLDIESGQWSTTSLSMYDNLHQPPGDTIWSLRGNAFSAGVRVTSDAGKTWQELASTGLPLALQMTSPTTGYLVRSEAFVVKASSVVFLLLKTTDGGKTFTQIAKLPTHFTRIFETAPNELVALSADNRVFLSKDGGLSWSEDGMESSESKS